MDERRRSKLKVTLALFGLVGVMASTFVAYNIERNVRSKKTVRESCVVLADSIEHEYTPEVLRMVFDNDADFVHDALVRNQRVLCERTLEHLSWYQVNLFGRMLVERNEEEERRLAEIFRRTEVSCPNVFASALEGMPGQQSHARALQFGTAQCARLMRNVQGLASMPSAEYTAWDWAARINAVAHSVSQQANAAHSRAPSPW